MRSFLLPWITHMGVKGMIESLAVNVLRVLGKMAANGWGQL